jgi:hypothetical protein
MQTLKSWSNCLYNFPYTPLTSSAWGPNILIYTKLYIHTMQQAKLITTLNRTQEDKILFTECKEALQCTLKLHMDVIFVYYCPSKIL